MELTDIFSLLGGLALFLYGMQMMSNGLEAAAGNRMKKILEKLTSNRFLGVLVGAGITAVIQSSSATTVMVVGFVNSGMMTLQQAVWIIMGANIGTTITGQLIALDIGVLAPLIAFIGVACIVFVKKEKVQYYGMIVAGLGVLFIGMDMMSAAMMPLRDSEMFVNMVASFSNPLLGILAGAVFTAIIQSSSASVGILQALAMSGIVDLGHAVYVLFGQNIGTCITAVLAAIGTSRNAKRTTIIHLSFNIIGTIVFTLVCMTTPLTTLVASWTPTNVSGQIANMHTLFNIVTTLLLLPFGTKLVALAQHILPEHKEDYQYIQHLEFIHKENLGKDGQNRQIGTSAIILNDIRSELGRMMEMVGKNIQEGFDCVLAGNSSQLMEVESREEYIDYLNTEISKYISKVMVRERNTQDAQTMSILFKVCGNLERIGDHAMNIGEYTNRIEENDIRFSSQELGEIAGMQKVCLEAMESLAQVDEDRQSKVELVQRYEQKIDDMTKEYRDNQLKRMKEGKCSDETSIIYSEMLTDFERIGDHMLNIAQEMGLRKVNA